MNITVKQGWVLGVLLAAFGALWLITDVTYAAFFAVGAHFGRVVRDWQYIQRKGQWL